MNIVVTIYTPNENIGTHITIEQIPETNNYKYEVKWDHEGSGGSWYGTIYNYEGHYLELVKKVLNGRDLS